MIKANRPISMIDPVHAASKNLKGGGGVNQDYRTTPSDTKAANAVDASKDSMSDEDYSGALKRAASSDLF